MCDLQHKSKLTKPSAAEDLWHQPSWAGVRFWHLATMLHGIASNMTKCMNYLHDHLTPTTLPYLKARQITAHRHLTQSKKNSHLGGLTETVNCNGSYRANPTATPTFYTSSIPLYSILTTQPQPSALTVETSRCPLLCSWHTLIFVVVVFS